jgi:putative transposase
MPQSLSSVHIHLVFSTKGRDPLLRNAEIRKEMHAYLGGVSKQLDCFPIIVGGTEDQVHVLGRLARTISQADWVKEIKRVSSIWIKQREPALATFAWQGGYGAFSVSASAIDKTCQYIGGQQEHHEKPTFQDEYSAFLRKHGMESDERFVWEGRNPVGVGVGDLGIGDIPPPG